jgi:hypothetical protein
MPAVVPEMDGYALASAQFRFDRGVDRIREIFFPGFA